MLYLYNITDKKGWQQPFFFDKLKLVPASNLSTSSAAFERYAVSAAFRLQHPVCGIGSTYSPLHTRPLAGVAGLYRLCT
jgi:hypothetical protein